VCVCIYIYINPVLGLTALILGLLTLGEGTDRFSRTALRNYHYSLRSIQEERRSHLLHGGSMKSRLDRLIVVTKMKIMLTFRRLTSTIVDVPHR